jgi:hypothetical protein
MPLQPPPRLSCVLAGVLALAGIVLTVASCSHLTPLGPAPPQPSQLRSPFVLQAMRVQPPAPAGGCPAGFATLSAPGAGPGACYRKLGTPVTITSAAISPVSSSRPHPPPGQQAGPVQYGFTITLAAAEVPALTAVTTTAADAQGPLAISAAGRTWVLPIVGRPFTSPQLLIPLQTKNQALQLQRTLVSSG